MTLLTPLGLLGLIGILILIIIYIIKPNYQQKFVSTTYVWKLSLKYRKKKIPVSKLRNILLIVCQVLILTICATILAEPAKVLKTPVLQREVIVVLDSSASMLTKWEDKTRFERAVKEITALSEEVFAENGRVSLILGDAKPRYLAERVTVENKAELTEVLQPLLEPTSVQNVGCSYGESDVNSALNMCDVVLEQNPDAKIYLYTDTTYSYVPEGVSLEVVNMANEREWNAAILDAYVEKSNGYYSFVVDVACYGDKSVELEVEITVNNANSQDKEDEGGGVTVKLQSSALAEQQIYCENDVTKRVIFINEDLYQKNETESEDLIYCLIPMDDRIFSFNSVHISVLEATGQVDCFTEDDNFNIYGGQKEVLKVQYASSMPNNFVDGALLTLQDIYSDRWDMRVTVVKQGEAPVLKGFDVYVFEHDSMPEEMPKDGVVILINPKEGFDLAGLRVGETYAIDEGDAEANGLTQDVERHSILNRIDASKITITQNKRITHDGNYESLLSFGGVPTLLVKDGVKEKIVVLSFSLHYSNLPIRAEFPLLMYNVFNFFLPTMVEGNAFSVGQSIELNSRCDSMEVSHKDGVIKSQIFTEFPATFKADVPGTYNLAQVTFAGKSIVERIYVKIPASESNIRRVEDTLELPYVEVDKSDYFDDLLVYFAAALVAILFIEWWLQSRDNM